MLESIASVGAGVAATATIVAIAMPGTAAARPHGIGAVLGRWRAAQSLTVREAGWAWLDGDRYIVCQAMAAAAGAITAATLTGLPVLAVPGATAGVALVRGAVARRASARRAVRQDAVLEAVRMLRQLLETGATSVNQAIAMLAERGPLALRPEFRVIASRTVGRRQAWKDARERIAEPLFDMLAAAVLIQRPGGGELAPLFADLESAVSAAQEVEREARALQAQARSASTIIVALPATFLVVLSALHSPYLDAFHTSTGQLFLVAMFCVMAFGYWWMRRLLRLDGLTRVRLADA